MSETGRNRFSIVLLFAYATLMSGAVVAASAAANADDHRQVAPAGVDPKLANESIARYIRQSNTPDSIGTGPYPAIKHEVPILPNHVVYEPADLATLKQVKMPIYVFGNGACSEDGSSQRHHLLEIASHGYFVIASGRIFSGNGTKLTAADWIKHRDNTSYRLIGEAIDWAISENTRSGSPYEGHIDTAHIAVSGYSCGGVQALRYVVDPRVKTFVIMNAGLSTQTGDRTGEMALSAEALDLIRVPTLYVLGGPRDVAYNVGSGDYARLTNVPAALINLDVGHQGTFSQPNGGAAAKAVVAWLEWQFRDKGEAARWFIGEECRLCLDPNWNIETRNLERSGAQQK